jgi:hypothetical protein
VHYVFNPDHYIGIVIANTTLSYKYKKVRFETGVVYILYNPKKNERRGIAIVNIYNKLRTELLSNHGTVFHSSFNIYIVFFTILQQIDSLV